MNNEYFEKYGYPLFCFDIGMYDMNDKRTYKEIARDIENHMKTQGKILDTHMSYINNHLGNIDGHLEKINTTNLNQEVKINRNKDRISLILKIIGGLILIMVGGVVTYLQGLW